MENNIWVYLERKQEQHSIAGVSLEILGKARELADVLGTEVTGVIAGSGERIEGQVEEVIHRGADRVLTVKHPLLDAYRPETYADALEDTIRGGDPSILLFGATQNGVDLAGQLAVRLDTGMNADVVRLDVGDDGNLVGGVPAFAGGILAMVSVTGRPQMSTVRPGVFTPMEPDPSREGSVESRKPDLREEDVVTEVLDRSVGESINLPGADVVVCAGMGFGEDLELARDLTEELDATLGVTRPLCDQGVVSRDRQIGSTGYSLNADLAIAIGISGSVYFTSGLDDVDTVIAVNNDAEEPIFDAADYCVEGDLFDVLPPLIDELQNERE